MLEKLADATMIFNGGYKVLNHSEIVEIFKQSL